MEVGYIGPIAIAAAYNKKKKQCKEIENFARVQ